jgi:hypothetical protein
MGNCNTLRFINDIQRAGYLYSDVLYNSIRYTVFPVETVQSISIPIDLLITSGIIKLAGPIRAKYG